MCTSGSEGSIVRVVRVRGTSQLATLDDWMLMCDIICSYITWTGDRRHAAEYVTHHNFTKCCRQRKKSHTVRQIHVLKTKTFQFAVDKTKNMLFDCRWFRTWTRLGGHKWSSVSAKVWQSVASSTPPSAETSTVTSCSSAGNAIAFIVAARLR